MLIFSENREYVFLINLDKGIVYWQFYKGYYLQSRTIRERIVDLESLQRFIDDINLYYGEIEYLISDINYDLLNR
jgi:hypothetical protein